MYVLTLRPVLTGLFQQLSRRQGRTPLRMMRSRSTWPHLLDQCCPLLQGRLCPDHLLHFLSVPGKVHSPAMDVQSTKRDTLSRLTSTFTISVSVLKLSVYFSRSLLYDMESESPQMYEAMYNIQAQALTTSGPQQARDSGTVMCEDLHLHTDSLPVYSAMWNTVSVLVQITLNCLLWPALMAWGILLVHVVRRRRRKRRRTAMTTPSPINLPT